MSFEFQVDLLAELDAQLVENNKQNRIYSTPRERPHLWPTESSVQWVASNGLTITEGACLRAVYYRLNGYPVTDDPIDRMYWVWEAGRDWEDHCNKLSKQRYMLAASSIKFQDTSLPLKVSGEMDAVNYYLDAHGDKHFYVIDYKSTGGSYYNQAKLMGNSKHKPFPKIANLLQLMVYLNYDPKLEFGMLVYLIRDKMDRTQFEIKLVRDEETGFIVANVNGKNYPKYSVNEIFRRYMMICDYYDRQQLPPRDYDFEYTDEKAQMLNDIGELSDSALKKHLGIKTKMYKQGSWNCLTGDTLIKTRDSKWKTIKNITENDYVEIGDESFKVKKFIDQGVKKNIVQVKPYLLMDYKCTDDHKIYAAYSTNYRKGWRERVELGFDFITPKDILTKSPEEARWYLQLPFSMKIYNDDSLSDELIFILAQFITEGSFARWIKNKPYAIQLTYSVEEYTTAEFALKIALKLGATSGKIVTYIDNRAEKERKSLQVKIRGVEFVSLIRKYIHGRYSYDKYFCNSAMMLPPERQRVLLDLMLKQDGSLLKMRTSSVENYSTTSRVLALQVQEMYLRNGQVASIVKQKGRIRNFGYMKCDCKDSYYVRYFRNTNSRSGWITDDNKFIVVLNKIEPVEQEEYVYDLSIDKQPVFVTQGGLVHNCNYCNFREQCELDGET